MNIKGIFVFFLLLLVTACGGAVETSEPDNPAPTNQPGYPSPPVEQNNPNTAYPGVETTIVPEAIPTSPIAPYEQANAPTPEEGTGAVVGRILDSNTNEPKPIRLYLGEKIEAEQGDGYFISTQQNSSPQGDSDENGYFVINNVPPGTYVLVVWTPMNSEVLVNPETNGEYWVDIKPDEVFDIGDLFSGIQ